MHNKKLSRPNTSCANRKSYNAIASPTLRFIYRTGWKKRRNILKSLDKMKPCLDKNKGWNLKASSLTLSLNTIPPPQINEAKLLNKYNNDPQDSLPLGLILKKKLCNKLENQSICHASRPPIIKMPSQSSIKLFETRCASKTSDEYKVSSLKNMMSKAPNSIDDNLERVEQPLSVNSKNTNNNEVQYSTKLMRQDILKHRPNHHLDNGCSVIANSLGKGRVTIYELSGSNALVVMEPESYFFVVGIIEVELLSGCVEVLGYRLTKMTKKLTIFSLPGSSHLFLKAKDESQTSCLERVALDQLLSLGLTEKKSRRIWKESECKTCFVVNRRKDKFSSTVWPTFFENHLSFSLFPPNDLLNQETRTCHTIEHKIDCLFDGNLQDLGFKEFTQVPEWSIIESEISLKRDFHPKMILCGGKSVGKSTLLRYITNKYLQKWDRVLVIDLDLGQCEFTVSGCTSVTLVEEPVLGPNYSHLKEPLRSIFLGEVDVTKCPDRYIEGCKGLITFAQQNHSTIPWLVNTMGFTRGFGVTLTCGIIKNVNPTHVIQIESKNRKLNFPSRLDPRFVYSQNVGSFSSAVEECVDYKLYTIPSGSEQGLSQRTRGISPAEARHLVTLSYLSQMLNSEVLSLSQVKPYMTSMEMVELQTTDKYNLTKAQIAATMNGNMVALCCLAKGDHNEFPNCIGFGIVRGIDFQTSTMFLITPLASCRLSKVNCLIKGNIALPDSLYYTQGDKVVGHIPFLAYTSGSSTSRFAKRDFRSLPATPREK